MTGANGSDVMLKRFRKDCSGTDFLVSQILTKPMSLSTKFIQNMKSSSWPLQNANPQTVLVSELDL